MDTSKNFMASFFDSIISSISQINFIVPTIKKNPNLFVEINLIKKPFLKMFIFLRSQPNISYYYFIVPENFKNKNIFQNFLFFSLNKIIKEKTQAPLFKGFSKPNNKFISNNFVDFILLLIQLKEFFSIWRQYFFPRMKSCFSLIVTLTFS